MSDTVEQIKERMCDNFCRVPLEAADKEERDALCSICPLNDLKDMSESINNLSMNYRNEIEKLGYLAKDSNICNTYIQGILVAYVNVLKDLKEIVNE